MLHKRSIYQVNKAYKEMLDDLGTELGWGKLKRQIMQDGHARTHQELADINHAVMLHINNLKLGRPSNAPEYVVRFAEQQKMQFDKIHDMGIGKVSGITRGNKINHYDHQVYNDHKILELANSPEKLEQVTELFRLGLVGGGMEDDIAHAAATALMQQKMNAMHRAGVRSSQQFGQEDIEGLMPKLQDIVDQMKENGVRPSDVKRFVDAFNGGGTHGQDAVPGYAQHRYNLDLEASVIIDQRRIRLVDLMDSDAPGRFERYSKESTARVAIAEAMPMLDSDEAINEYLFNVGKQAQLMGTSVDTKIMRNSLNILMGRQPIGSLPMDVRKVRDLVALAGMGGLGESQLAETGMAIARGVAASVGVKNMWRARKARKKVRGGLRFTQEELEDNRFMWEMEELTGTYQEAHQFQRWNVHYDQADSDYGALSKFVETATGGRYRNSFKAAQTKYTGYGAIRNMQDQVAMSSMLQDIARAFRGKEAFTSVERFRDLGLNIEYKDNVFFRNMLEYAEFDSDGYVKGLNINMWSAADRDAAGIILNRHTSQVVQRGYVGEMSPLMDNPWVSFMMQFRTYPMLAAEKQQARHIKFGDKEMATGLFLNSVSSAGARVIRYGSLSMAQPWGERQEYLNRKMNSLGADTWAYMGPAGTTPMLASYATQLMGHPFGLGQGGRPVEGLQSEMPALGYAEELVNMVGSITDNKPMSDTDYARAQSLQILGTTAQFNLLWGMFRTAADAGDEGDEYE
jgi:hypothetical protein